MSRFHSYLTTAIRLIDTYHAGKPFAHQLKYFFSSEKKYGSRDRKIISSLCYQYFRTSHLLEDISGVEEKIISAVFLCENESNDFLSIIRPDWNAQIQIPLENKFELLKLTPEKIFPFKQELSDEINKESFFLSFLKQPKLFIRIRPGKRTTVFKKLNEAAIAFEESGEESLFFSQNISLENVLKINRDIVVQDLNSQKVLDGIQWSDLIKNNELLDVWDCCAASGGKSILLYDRVAGKIKLTVSDIRETIIGNLSTRLADAGIPLYKKFVQDLSVSAGLSRSDKYDVVICDAPCTGSGTWSRNPEQLHSFKMNSLADFSKTQQSIVLNVLPQVKENGYLVYITCSVFAKENEHIVSFIQEKSNLQFIQMKYWKGYDEGADTMFVAVFKR